MNWNLIAMLAGAVFWLLWTWHHGYSVGRLKGYREAIALLDDDDEPDDPEGEEIHDPDERPALRVVGQSWE